VPYKVLACIVAEILLNLFAREQKDFARSKSAAADNFLPFEISHVSGTHQPI
jgi:hypothetical protein